MALHTRQYSTPNICVSLQRRLWSMLLDVHLVQHSVSASFNPACQSVPLEGCILCDWMLGSCSSVFPTRIPGSCRSLLINQRYIAYLDMAAACQQTVCFFPQVCSLWVEIDLHVFFCAAWWLAHVTQQCCSKCVDTNSNCWVSSVVCCCSALLCCHAVSSHPWRFFSKLQHHISSTAVQAATAPHCSTWCMRACSTAMHESRHGP